MQSDPTSNQLGPIPGISGFKVGDQVHASYGGIYTRHLEDKKLLVYGAADNLDPLWIKVADEQNNYLGVVKVSCLRHGWPKIRVVRKKATIDNYLRSIEEERELERENRERESIESIDLIDTQLRLGDL